MRFLIEPVEELESATPIPVLGVAFYASYTF